MIWSGRDCNPLRSRSRFTGFFLSLGLFGDYRRDDRCREDDRDDKYARMKKVVGLAESELGSRMPFPGFVFP